MAKPCKPCMAKRANKVAQYSNYKYVLKNAQGQVTKEFGNKTSAAIELSKHPGYTLHPVTASKQESLKTDPIGE